jgi:hypothetical protein
MTTFYKNLRPKLFLLLATLLCGISSSFGQSSNYGFAQSTGTYTPITGTTSTATGDDGTQNQLPIGFTFNFAGSPYTTFSVTTNGFIKLGTSNIVTGTNNYDNDDYFGSPVNTNGNVPMLAIFWDDNNLTGGNIQYTTTGTTGSQILTIQWTSCHMGGSGSSSSPTSNFQIKLFEGTNVVQYVYGITSAALTSSTASIGISSAATNYLSVTPGTTATASNSTLNSAVAASVTANTIYTFTPPPACTGAPTPGNTISSATAVCSGVGFTLSLQNNPAVSGLTYLWQTSTDGITYVAATGTNNGSTYAATQTAATYYRAVVTCATGPTSTNSAPVQVAMSAFSSCYCTPSSSCVNEGIENVTMGTLNNSSTFCTNSTGYSDFTSLGSLTSASQGAAVPISVSAHINSNPAYAGVWIDYDHNGIFDALEYQSLGSAAVTIPSGGVSYTFTGTINVNVGALTGITRMRVRSANQDGITATSACNTGGVYGEYEDYLITITAGTACTGTPSGGTASASNTTACPNGSTILSATGYTAGVTGVIYQWQVSTNGGSTYANIGAGTLNYANYTVTNITQTAQYRLSVLCGPSTTTGFGTPVTVTVPGPLSLNVDEGFNAASFPGCWTEQYVTGTSDISFQTSSTNPATAPIEGAGFVYWNGFNITAGNTTRLVSPPINTTGAPSVDVDFYWMNENSVNYNSGVYLNEGVQVQYSLNGTTWIDAGPFIARYDASLASGVNQWKQKFVTLPAAAGNVASVYVGFKFVSQYGDNCAMDAVHIEPTPACQVPTNLTNTTVTSTGATLNWTASTSAPANGYQYYVSATNTAPTATTTPTGSVGAGVTTVTLSTLNASTTYYAWVRSACGAASTSLWTLSTSFLTLPSCQIPTALTNSNLTATTVTISWTAPTTAPASGYEYYVSTTNTAPIATTTPTGSTAAGITTKNITALTAQTTYYVWVRSKCSGTLSSDWIATPLTFTTFCAAIAPSWTEGFESLTTLGSSNFPSCWVKENGDWSSSASTTYNTAHGGANYIRDAWSASNEYIWTPSFQLVAGTSYDFSFYVQGDGYTSWNMDVFQNTTQNSVGATQIGTTYSPTGPGSQAIQPYVQKTYTFVPTTSGAYSFGIRVNESTGDPWYLAFDDFSLGLTPSCAAPTIAATTNVTSATGTINWTAPTAAPANGYQYYYSTTNTAPTSTTTPSGSVGAGITTANLTALTPNTTYYVWARSACGTATFSTWSASTSFTTQCTPTALPFTEGFNTASSSTLPQCWSQQFVTGNSSLSFETAITDPDANPYEGTRSVFWNAYNINSGSTRLVSAPLSSTGVGGVDVKFYWLNDNTNYTDPADGYYDEGVQVQYSLDGVNWTDAGAFIPRPDTTIAADTAIWQLKTVTLPVAAANQALLYVGFKFVSQYGDNCALDAVNILASCPVVDLGANVVTCNTGTFSDTLNAGNTGATYLWDNATTLQTRIVNTAGNYYVAVTKNGCTKSDTVTVTLNALPIVNLGNDTAICTGTPLLLNAGNAGSTYVWDDTTTTQTRSVSAAGTYDVKVTDTSACSASDTIHVTILPMPSATISAATTTTGVYTFSLTNPVNVIASLWNFGDNGTGSGSPITHTYTNNGTYNVNVLLVGMCNDTVLATQNVTVSGITAINTINIGADLLTLYPNPANNVVNIVNKSTYAMQSISLYNVVGQLIYNGVTDSKTNHTLQLSGIASGMYTLKIETDKGFVMRKFEVVR